MKKFINILLVIFFVLYWQGGPGTEIRYMKDYGVYTTNIDEAIKFDTPGKADEFQSNHSKMYKDDIDGFHMGKWYIKEIN